MTELRCALSIFREKDAFDGRNCGRVRRNDFRQPIVDVDQTIRKRALEIHVDDPMRNMLDAAAFTMQDAPSQMSTSRVDAKNTHGPFLADPMTATRENFVGVQKVFRVKHTLDVALQLDEFW
jgi:hypothetical protein